MSLGPFLQQLASAMQLKGLKPDQNGACLVTVKKGGSPLLFEYDSRIINDTILLSSPIGMLNEENKGILHQFLKQNQEIEETFSFRINENQLYLHRRFSCDISSKELKVLVDAFLNQLCLAKESLKQAHSLQTVESEASKPPAGPHLKV